MSIRVLALAAILAALGATSALAATVKLNVVGGQLLGASNVPVDGMLYDVEFVDTSCVAAFDGCDRAASFDFSTFFKARAAAQSLLDFVFVDGPMGNFDSNPALTAGIEPDQGNSSALVLIPYRNIFSVFVNAAGALNGVTIDSIRPREAIPFDTDFSTNPLVTFARFTPSQVAAVPLPAGAVLLLAGLAGLGALRARRKAATAS